MDSGIVSREPLRHNPQNEVTGSVERVTLQDGRMLVRKELRRPGSSSGESLGPWAASLDPRHWNYWRREADVYASGELRDSLRSTGLSMPAAEVEEHDDWIVMWLENVIGTPGTSFELAQHAAIAEALGRWQGQGAFVASWTSRRFLRAYSTTRPALWSVLDDDEAWQHPLIRETWPASLREDWQRLRAHQRLLLEVMERLPRTRSHLDFWVSNQIGRPDGDFVLFDWAFAGDGAVGEDLGNHLLDAIFDLFWPGEQAGELDAACFASYVAGLRAAGWSGTDDDARLGVVASCVKYVWLLPFMLERAGQEQHRAYFQAADSRNLYYQRGLGLQQVTRWLDEALKLTGTLE